MAKDIKIVYTPLHGTGLGPVKRVLHDLGFENVYIEPQQAVADGHFPTAPYPNPENRMHGNWHLSLQRKRMQIWFWQPIRMPTVWVYTARIRKAASM